jgi:hypothetical protein
LRNIREIPYHLDLNCNAGTRRTNTVGDLPGYGTVWYDPGGISNILSMSRASKKHRVSFDSEQGNTFLVTKPDGTNFEFIQSDAGFYYIDNSNQGVALVTTVAPYKN